MAATQAEINGLYNTRSYTHTPYLATDFWIEVGNCKFGVHKRVLAECSKHLDPAVSLPFRDPSTNTQTLFNECPLMIARMILWMYLGKKTAVGVEAKPFSIMFRNRNLNEVDRASKEDKQRKGWQIVAMMYKLAHTYVIPDLLIEARAALTSHIFSTPADNKAIIRIIWPSVVETDTGLTETILRSILQYSKSISEYNSIVEQTFEGDGCEGIKELSQTFIFDELHARTDTMQRLYNHVLTTQNCFENHIKYKSSELKIWYDLKDKHIPNTARAIESFTYVDRIPVQNKPTGEGKETPKK